MNIYIYIYVYYIQSAHRVFAKTVTRSCRYSANRSLDAGAGLPVRLYLQYYAVILNIKAHLY